MEKIFEKLRKDHDRQRALLDQLTSTSGNTKERRECFRKLVDEIENHATYEERFFYRPLMDTNTTQDIARQNIAEHFEFDELIAELEEKDMSSPGWLVSAKQLQKKILQHFAEEERRLFQMAGKEFSAFDKVVRGAAYSSGMNEARA